MPWYPASITKLMTTYVTLQAVKNRRITLDTLVHRFGARRVAGAVEDGLQARQPGHRRQRAEDADGEVGQRHGRGARRRRFRLGREFLRRDEPDQPAARHDPVELGQSERPAGRRADHLGARPRDPRPRAAARFPGIRHVLEYSGDPDGQEGDAQLQHADRPLRWRRRHEDRLHLRLRLQPRGHRDAQQQAADRGRARRASRRPIAAPRPRACSSAASTAARCPGSRRRSARWSSCSRSTSRRPICATRCAARTASARPPRRPTTRAKRRASCFPSLPPSSGKASSLVKERPGAVKAIAVYPRRRQEGAPRRSSPTRARSSPSSARARPARRRR